MGQWTYSKHAGVQMSPNILILPDLSAHLQTSVAQLPNAGRSTVIAHVMFTGTCRWEGLGIRLSQTIVHELTLSAAHFYRGQCEKKT